MKFSKELLNFLEDFYSMDGALKLACFYHIYRTLLLFLYSGRLEEQGEGIECRGMFWSPNTLFEWELKACLPMMRSRFLHSLSFPVIYVKLLVHSFIHSSMQLANTEHRSGHCWWPLRSPAPFRRSFHLGVPSPPIPVPATVLCAERSVDNWRHFAYKSREPEAPRGSCPRISFLLLPKQITTDLEA